MFGCSSSSSVALPARRLLLSVLCPTSALSCAAPAAAAPFSHYHLGCRCCWKRERFSAAAVKRQSHCGRGRRTQHSTRSYYSSCAVLSKSCCNRSSNPTCRGSSNSRRNRSRYPSPTSDPTEGHSSSSNSRSHCRSGSSSARSSNCSSRKSNSSDSSSNSCSSETCSGSSASVRCVREIVCCWRGGGAAAATEGRSGGTQMASLLTGGLAQWDYLLLQQLQQRPTGAAAAASLSSAAAPAAGTTQGGSRSSSSNSSSAPPSNSSSSVPPSNSSTTKSSNSNRSSSSLRDDVVNSISDALLRETAEWPAPRVSSLPLQERYESCLRVAEECVQPEELLAVLQRKDHPICYDGFEPSGRMHVAQGLLKVLHVNELTRAGCVFVFWVADWFALLNNKMEGDLQKIQKVGQYFIEIWKAAGMNMQNVRFLWASEQINKNPQTYWMQVMNIARTFNITRIKRCSQIMGRSEGDDQPAAQILYPCMQCADVFYLKADICQLGMDQRKVNMLAREYAEAKKKKKNERPLRPPVVLSHRMLPGLLQGHEKMSKSMPDSAIFMEDSEADVRRKIKKAFCPPGVVEGNPCITYVEELVLRARQPFEVKRSAENGGNVIFETTQQLREAYAAGELHPSDLKENLAAAINARLEPVRRHFDEDPRARLLLQEIKSYRVSR